MATTSSSDSLAPTSTLSSSSSNPTASDSSNSNGGGIADIFSASESPPLIVAFLAIGVFIVALSGVFGWRRLSQSPGVVSPPPGTTNRRRKSILLGKKPVLFDLWADLRAASVSSTDAVGHCLWEHILPMSASMTFPVSSVEPQASVDPMSTTTRSGPMADYPILSRLLRGFATAARRYYLPVRPPRPPPPSPPPPLSQAIPLVPMASRSERAEQLQLKTLATSPCVSQDALDEGNWGDALSVQVSVIVAMPSQRQFGCWNGCGAEGKEGTRLVPEDVPLELGEYCIGTMDAPWGEAG